MKREDLTAKGLTTEQIDFVMAEYGKEINPLKAERDSRYDRNDKSKNEQSVFFYGVRRNQDGKRTGTGDC